LRDCLILFYGINSICYGFIRRFLAVFIDLGLVLLAVGQAAGAADAAAEARHSLDEVAVEEILVLLEKCHAASLYSVADNGLEIELDVLLRHCRRDSLGKTARAGEDASVIGCVVESRFLKQGDVDVAAVEESLKLLEGDDRVNVGLDVLALSLPLLCRARSDEYDLCIRIALLDDLREKCHRRGVMRDELLQIRESGVYVGHESGAAGACEETLFRKLARLGKSDKIGAESGFDDLVKSELAQTRDDLTVLRICKLACDRGSDHSIDLARALALALFDDLDDVNDEGLIRDRAEGALINAGAATDALVVVDKSRLLLVHRNCLDLAGVLTGTGALYDSGVGADLRAGTALDAFRFVDMRDVVFVEGERALLANVLATVGKAASAGIRDLISADGTLVTGDLDDLNDVGVLSVAADSKLNALAKYCALLINATAHRRLVSGNDDLGNVDAILKQAVVPRKTGDLAEHLIFQMLNFCIEFTHFYTL